MLSPEYKTAIIRGAYSSIGTGAATVLTGMLADVSLTKSLIMGGIALLAVLGFRGGAEGTIDTNRAK